MSQSVAIVIPIVNSYPTTNEEISIKQSLRILRDHDIFFIHPESLDTKAIEKIIKNESPRRKSPRFLGVHPALLASIESYNRWLLTPYFYEQFSDYEHICICQTDVFLFKNNLNFWVQQGWDYIGAPWFEGWGTPKSDKLIGAGNGGFSLRRVNSMIQVLTQRKTIHSAAGLFREALRARFDLVYLRELIEHNSTHFSKIRPGINEDCWFAMHVPKYFPEFRVAPPEIAKRFSVEVNPRFLMNSKTLPTGCHAWWKYDPAFIFPIIREFGYLPVDTRKSQVNE